MKNYIGETLLSVLKENFPFVEYDAEAKEPAVYVNTESIPAVLKFLRDDERFRFSRLENLTAVDYKTYFEMVYHLFAWGENMWITVKAKTDDHNSPVIPSVTKVFPGAEFEEREVFDLMGISFADHPDLRRVLLPDDFEGHPLRKDYKQIMPPRVPRIEKGAR